MLPIVAKAQGVVAHSIELSANGGITNEYGVNGNHGHATYGGAGAYNLTRHLAVVGEYNYVNLGSESGGGFSESGNTQLYGAAVRYALINTRFFVPYVLGGGGADRIHESASADGENLTASESGGYVAVGGGASFYVGHGFGVRPEFRYTRQEYGSTTIEDESVQGSTENDLRATVSIFYQFGGRPRS